MLHPYVINNVLTLWGNNKTHIKEVLSCLFEGDIIWAKKIVRRRRTDEDRRHVERRNKH